MLQALRKIELKRVIPPVFLALLAIGYMVQASGFDDETSAEAPMLYGAALLGVAVLVLVLGFIPGFKPRPKVGRLRHEADAPFNWRASLTIFAIIAVFIGFVFAAGFYVAIPVFLFLFLTFISKVAWWQALITAALAYAFVFAVFGQFLHLEVFSGYLAHII